MSEEKPCRPYLPPEWALQSGVMLTWPHGHSDWAGDLAEVDCVFAAIAKEITAREKLLVVCYDADHRAQLRRILSEAGIAADRLIFSIAPSNDSWSRDHGPITVLCRNQPAIFDFQFNGWGGKYPADLDNAITARLHGELRFGDAPLEKMDFVLEGGSIDVDGGGALLTTRRCLLAPTRNPGLTATQIEDRLGELLGINRVLWLNHGKLAGDDTDSHIDTLARFCDPETIAYVSCDDSKDPHFEELRAMERELRALRASTGLPYRLAPLPMPQPKYDVHGNRLPATYANFLIVNEAVLVPIYDDPADKIAMQRLRNCFPNRSIVPINCLALIRQFGSLHCVTMQLPAGVL
jgi:agmatine deiminase